MTGDGVDGAGPGADGEPVRLADLVPFGGTPGLTAADRLDPYWGGLWAQGAAARWTWRALEEARAVEDLSRVPARFSMSVQDAVATLSAGARRGSWMAALGAVDQWRTMSVEQVAALTGWTALVKPDPAVLRALLSLGVLDRGVPQVSRPGAALRRATLLRPSRSEAFDEHVAPLLSWEQRVGVTGGMPWDWRRQYDRHNVLAVELGLRVAELCDVGTVLGELLSDVSLLLGGAPSGGGRAADLTVVRADGLRIAVEITANAGPGFKEKVRSWARLLADRSLSSCGLMVVFVEAAPPNGDIRFGRKRTVRGSVYKAVREVVREFPGTGRDRVAERIAVATWQRWFPGSGLASPGFTSLEADRPVGPPDDPWRRAGLLDIVDVPFSPHDPAAMTAVIGNAAMLYGTPHWLRDPALRVDLWPTLTGRAGWQLGLPVPPPSRPGRVKGRYQPASLGVLGATRPPRRMRAELADPPPVRPPASGGRPVAW